MLTEGPENQRLDQGRTEMEGQNLLRPSRTVRSSIQSLSSLNDMTHELQEEDIEEQKPHGKPGSSPNCSCSKRFLRILCIVSVSLSIYVIFIYFSQDGIPTSENLLLVLIFIAILLYLAGRNKGFVRRSFWVLRRIHDGCSKKVGLISNNHHKPVEWFIGESTEARNDRNLIVREGVEFLSNGDFYEGEFHKGKCNGSGVYNYFVSGRYEGDWIDGRYDGYGIECWARGSRYRGQYRQGLRHGYGVYRFFTGDTYAGEWLNGQSNGVGMQTCSDGSCYVGEFKIGVKHGLGCYHFRNGDTYAGEYFGDKIHGFGVYQFANGHCYAGSWHDGRKQGYGVYTFQSGEKRCGEWDRGNLKLSMSPFSEMVVRAFEAARKTAEKAIQVRRVDQQVNEAATAAKKAATAARVAAVKAVQNRMDGKFCETNIY